MSDPQSTDLQKLSRHGTVASHPTRDTQPFFAAPTDTDLLNTFGLDLVPVACMSFNDILFDFDSSFVTPEAIKIFQHLPALRQQHKNRKGEMPPLSVFGHADPVGKDEYNKTLSGRRAKAVFGVLTHDVTMWRHLLDAPFAGDDWKAKGMLARMRGALGDTENRPADAVIADYQILLCPDAIPKSDFLGQGSDEKGVAAFQGCGEFNPLVILSKSDAALNHDDRNSANQPNRRVAVFLFRAGTKVNAALWPCPSADEPTTKCRRRLFLDANTRLAPTELRREHKEVQAKDPDPSVDTKTFSCRFYDRIARLSPCERILRNFRLKLFDQQAEPLPFAPFVVLHGATDVGRADEEATLTVPAITVPDTCTVKWSRPQPGDGALSPIPGEGDTFEFQLEVFVDIPDEQNDDAIALQRLHNLGYTAGPTPDDDIADFQSDYRSRLPAATLAQNLGKLDQATKDVLQEAYNAADPLVKTLPPDPAP